MKNTCSAFTTTGSKERHFFFLFFFQINLRFIQDECAHLTQKFYFHRKNGIALLIINRQISLLHIITTDKTRKNKSISNNYAKLFYFYTLVKALNPPSIDIDIPVMKLAASLQRNCTAPFSSLISPNLRIGVLAITF